MRPGENPRNDCPTGSGGRSPAIGRTSRGERLTRRRRRDPQRRGDVAGDGTPPRPRPLRRAGVRTARAAENEPISLVIPLLHRPLVGNRPVVEAAGGHREDAAGSEPGVIVHGPCIGGPCNMRCTAAPRLRFLDRVRVSGPRTPEIAVQGILADRGRLAAPPPAPRPNWSQPCNPRHRGRPGPRGGPGMTATAGRPICHPRLRSNSGSTLGRVPRPPGTLLSCRPLRRGRC